MHESLDASFKRIEYITGISIEPSKENLLKIQKKEIPLNGMEDSIAIAFHQDLLNYCDTLEKLSDMLDDAQSESVRNYLKDSSGKGWKYNWFCLDLVDVIENPRNRLIGHHLVYDFYKNRLKDNKSDTIHFHFHPVAFNKDASCSATQWIGHSDSLFQILSRKIIERNWFPSCVRPGFHVTRPDSHWFQEQYIPFEYANQSMQGDNEITQTDLSNNRFGDWTRAPKNWIPYNPSHDDYQSIGNCRRTIGRCLNIGTRFRLITINDIRQAFHEAKKGLKPIISIANHDYRDITPDVRNFMEMLNVVSKEFQEVEFAYSDPLEAMRWSKNIKTGEGPQMELHISDDKDSMMVIELVAKNSTFGPQPYLAIEDTSSNFYYDNFDIVIPFKQWRYVFDKETIRKDLLKGFGIASNDSSGVTQILNYCCKTKKITETILNR